MRILLLNTAYPPPMIGGAEKAVSLLASGLVRQGHVVHVLAKHDCKQVTQEILDGVEVTRMPVDNLYWPFSGKPTSALRRALWHLVEMWNLRTAYRVGKLMDEFKPDVFHTQNHSCFSIAVWAQARRRGIRLVHTMHDYSLFCSRATALKDHAVCSGQCLDCRFYSLLRKPASRMVDHAIAVSSRTLELHRQRGYFIKTPSTIVHNICELRPDTVSVPTSSILGAPLRFGYIGRITKEKGIETMLDAFRRLPRGGWRLRIAGDGDPAYVSSLRLNAHAEIEWPGYLPANDFYRSVDVVLIPSLWEEPMPYTAVEALMYGKPIIASLTGGIAEAAGRAPVLATFDPGDADGFSKALQQALSDPEHWRSTYSLAEDQLKDFHESSVIRAHLQIYRSDSEGDT